MSSDNRIIHEIHEELDQLLDVIQDLSVRAKPKSFAVNDEAPNLTPFDPNPPPPPPRSHKQLTSQLLRESNKVVKESLCTLSSSVTTCHEERVVGESAHEVNHQQFTTTSSGTSGSPPRSPGCIEQSEIARKDEQNGQDEALEEEEREGKRITCQEGHEEVASFPPKYLVNTLHVFDPGDLSTAVATTTTSTTKDALENNNNKLLALPPCVCKLCTCKYSDDTCGVNGIEAPMNNPKSIIVKSSSSIPAEIEKSTLAPTVILSQVLVVEVTSIVDYVPVTRRNSSDYFIGKIFLTWYEREAEKQQHQHQQQQKQRQQWSTQLSNTNDRANYSPSCGCCVAVNVNINSSSTPSLSQRQMHQSSCSSSTRLSVSSPSLPLSLAKKPRITGTTFKRRQFGSEFKSPELPALEKLISPQLSQIQAILEEQLRYQQYDCRSYTKTFDPRTISEAESLVATGGGPVTMRVYEKVQLYSRSVTSDCEPVSSSVVREVDLLLSNTINFNNNNNSTFTSREATMAHLS